MSPARQVKNIIHFDLAAPTIIFALFFIVYTIIGLSGYGNDCDTYSMLKSGRRLLFDGVYQYSRTPGYFIPEIVIGWVSLIGGHFLSNLISSFLGATSLYFFWHLLILSKRLSNLNAILTTAIVGLNPHFMIAASSSMDYVYSLFFGLLGITALSKKKPFVASLFFAFAISSRLSNILIIGVIYTYFLYIMHKKNEYGDMARVFLSGFLATCLSTVLFLPSFLASGKTLGFLTYSIGDWSFFGHLSRFVYKNIYLFGLIQFFLLVGVTVWSVAKKKVVFSFGPEIIAGLAIISVHEVLFFKVPLEISYLLPLLFFAIPIFVLIVAPQKTALYVLLGFTVLYGFVINPDILDRRYNETGEAIGANVGLFLRPGMVIADILERENSKNKYFKSYEISPEN
jgi:hypothetical protein